MGDASDAVVAVHKRIHRATSLDFLRAIEIRLGLLFFWPTARSFSGFEVEDLRHLPGEEICVLP